MRASRSAFWWCVITVLLAGVGACSSSGSGSPQRTSSGSGSAATIPAGSSEVSFDASGTTTYGTLEVPAHRDGQRLAAALLIPGSGPTDRDGNDQRAGLTAATLKLVADLLANQGIMSLRYDKYGAGKTGTGRFTDDPGAITIQDFFAQADDAYEFLAKQPQADPAKLLVVGHSEGGMVALAVATSVTSKPAGLGLLEPQDQRILNLIQLQVNEHLDTFAAQGTFTADEARANAQLVANAIKQFRAGEKVDTTGMAAQVIQLIAPEILAPQNENFERSNDLIVPAQLAAKVARGTRVLVTEGTRDQNVPPRTVGPLVQALDAAGTTGPGLTVLQGTDHLLHLSGQPEGQAVLAPAAIQAIEQWAQPFAAPK